MGRRVFTELVETYKKKMLLFMDYHGHSTRKNAFLLGPGIFDAQLMNDIRILPKIMASYSDIFRYPSCSFRLDDSKKTTARALFGKFAGLSYTVETSNWSYYSYMTKTAYEMNASHFQKLGIALFNGVQDFILGKMEARNKYVLKMKEETSKMKIFKSKQDLKLRKSVTSREVESPQRLRFKDSRTKTENMIAEPPVEMLSLSKIEERPNSEK
jgi:cytosolic carboxypeptidase protein 2/3